jgi:hypothetical protein
MHDMLSRHREADARVRSLEQSDPAYDAAVRELDAAQRAIFAPVRTGGATSSLSIAKTGADLVTRRAADEP